MSNQLKRVVESSKWLPANVRATVVSKILGKVVPYVGNCPGSRLRLWYSS